LRLSRRRVSYSKQLSITRHAKNRHKKTKNAEREMCEKIWLIGQGTPDDKRKPATGGSLQIAGRGASLSRVVADDFTP